MSNVVIVAIPKEHEHVMKVSSEKVPHLTLLFLGDSVANPEHITQFVEHAASTMLTPFELDVERRGTLGDDEADVLFFSQRWGIDRVKAFRNALLQNPAIKTAYDSVEQYPTWTPHLTLGYPASPAKETEDEHGLQWIRFDRIAIWFGDSEGPTFQLVEPDPEPEFMMSDPVDDFLSHYGVKGMKWGKRKAQLAPGTGTVDINQSKSGKIKIKAKAGPAKGASDDAVAAARTKSVAKTSGLNALSNKDLEALATRMRLEQQVKQLSAQQAPAGKKFIAGLLGNTAKQQATRVANEAAAKQVAGMMAGKK